METPLSDAAGWQPNVAVAAVEKNSRFWRRVAWGISLLFLAAALGFFISKQFASGIFFLLCGALLFPPFNFWVRRRTNGAFSRKVTVVTAIAFLIPPAFFINNEVKARRVIEERKTALEQRYRDSIRIVTEEKQTKAAFLKKYPFVEAAAYDYWMMMNEDSATTPSHTLNAFLEAEKRKHALRMAQKHTDSIEAARFARVTTKQSRAEEAQSEISEEPVTTGSALPASSAAR